MSENKTGGEKLFVIHEDNHIIVVVKPPNTPTQEDETGDADLANEIKAHLKEKYNKPGNVFLGMVHRLDRPVGGVMVFAKTSKAASRLSDQFRRGVVEKKYAALVEGIISSGTYALTHYLKKDRTKNRTTAFAKPSTGAKEAKLTYSVEESWGDTTLLSVTPHTGRSHQIRVQLSTTGYPIVGDLKYGAKTTTGDKSIMLWATRLKFTHPVTKEEMIFEAAIPKSWNY
jgi:23S rRNA pseudouridine1911/1915/1917 synthase